MDKKNQINLSIIKDLEKKYNKKIEKEELKNVIVNNNLETLINNKMAEFESTTKPLAKKFAKFTKKMNGKNPNAQKERVINFVKKEIDYFWEKHIVNNISFLKESKEFLPEDVYYTYVFGFFVTLHSKNLKRKEKIDTMTRALAEIKINTERMQKAINEYIQKNKEENND